LPQKVFDDSSSKYQFAPLLGALFYLKLIQ